MDIINFTDKFQEIETKYDFFNDLDIDGSLYWDVVRHDIFYLIYNEISNLERITPAEKQLPFRKDVLKIIYILFGYLIFLYKIYFLKYKFIFFTTSRNMSKNGEAIDLISNDVLTSVTDSKFIIESLNLSNINIFASNIFDYVLLLKLKIRNIFKNRPREYYAASILKKEFNCNSDLNSQITTKIIYHKIKLRHYINIFRQINPKCIFVMQNGINKSIFEAANILNIRVVELQHGYIGYVHPAYSYPKYINAGDLNTVPSDFFSFSDFWTSKFNFPVKRIYPIGNSFSSIKPFQVKKEYDLTFIFADVYTKIFLPMIDDLLIRGYNGIICLKLHPNQIQELEIITLRFINIPNVIVLANEYPMSDVLSKSKAIIGIQSTSLYEAIHIGGIIVYILKKIDYRLHEDIFMFNNVRLINNVDEILINEECNTYSMNNEVIFEPFKIDTFNKFISTLQ